MKGLKRVPSVNNRHRLIKNSQRFHRLETQDQMKRDSVWESISVTSNGEFTYIYTYNTYIYDRKFFLPNDVLKNVLKFNFTTLY